MNDPAANIPPAVGVLTAYDYDVSRHAQVAQSAMQAHRLLGPVVDFWLNDKEVKIAVGLAPSQA